MGFDDIKKVRRGCNEDLVYSGRDLLSIFSLWVFVVSGTRDMWSCWDGLPFVDCLRGWVSDGWNEWFFLFFGAVNRRGSVLFGGVLGVCDQCE